MPEVLSAKSAQKWMHDNQDLNSSSVGQENRKKKWTGQQGTTDELFESVGKNTASRQNLCELLGIDVEKLALAIVMQDKGLHQ